MSMLARARPHRRLEAAIAEGHSIRIRRRPPGVAFGGAIAGARWRHQYPLAPVAAGIRRSMLISRRRPTPSAVDAQPASGSPHHGGERSTSAFTSMMGHNQLRFITLAPASRALSVSE